MISLSSFLSTGFPERYSVIIRKDASRIQHISKEASKLNSIFSLMKKKNLGYSLVGGTVNNITLDFGYQNFKV